MNNNIAAFILGKPTSTPTDYTFVSEIINIESVDGACWRVKKTSVLFMPELDTWFVFMPNNDEWCTVSYDLIFMFWKTHCISDRKVIMEKHRDVY